MWRPPNCPGSCPPVVVQIELKNNEIPEFLQPYCLDNGKRCPQLTPGWFDGCYSLRDDHDGIHFFCPPSSTCPSYTCGAPTPIPNAPDGWTHCYWGDGCIRG